MTQITIRQLRSLVAAAEAGRFRLAAERANISQPAFSEQIAQLEHHLGVKLFERGKQGAKLTPTGEEVVARARLILAHLKELAESVVARGQSLGGLIRLGALPTIGPYLLPSVVPELHAAHPDLRLYVREANNVELEARLRDGVFDTILSTPPDDAEGFRVEPLFEEGLLLGLARDHRLAGRQTLTVANLAGEKVLTLESGHYLSGRARGLAEAANAKVQIDYEGTSLDGLRQMVGLGMGISLFPALYVRAEMVSDPGVAVRKIDIKDASRWIALVWRRSSPRSDDFLELARRLRDHGRRLLDGIIIETEKTAPSVPTASSRSRPKHKLKRKAS